ncbi:hypothetical protein GLAREA_09542 [Glarea lozoyensis ATCC 20868]|uniref:Uncharacterized protein n=1 Tax=Glarea lozoyensis (strain ATCC 20868 / MF5171) TaxID=1116229 RepID=S3CPL8_GLAL2|nr:uncharacterized protein GLAREA_09542 [Glarea lozoyensis ATCC 20868]EPE28422.1 hypothetical protein GLAREA_09542 [Glarea lozoyensis ATCC 20868]
MTTLYFVLRYLTVYSTGVESALRNQELTLAIPRPASLAGLSRDQELLVASGLQTSLLQGSTSSLAMRWYRLEAGQLARRHDAAKACSDAF